MLSFDQSKMLILVLMLVGSGFCKDGRQIKSPIKRSYQVHPIPVMNDLQGIPYFAAARPLYTAVPTVLIPSQISLSATPVATLTRPPPDDPKTPLETSTAIYANVKPNRIPSHFYKHSPRGSVHHGKRPLHQIYGHPVRKKPSQKVSSLSIQPSLDLSSHFNQEAASSLYQSTVLPPVGSTYGPAKAVDFQNKNRSPGINGQTVYHRLKGASTNRHPFHPSKKIRVYSHVHKDHVHNHYLPAGHNYPIYSPPKSSKYAGPAYLPPAQPTASTLLETRPLHVNPPTYNYQSNNQVRFPENEEIIHQHGIKDQIEGHKGNTAPGDVTQAIIKKPGVINNYDASLPLKVPTKKPYQFEINNILKNSDLHFVQENPEVENKAFLQYPDKIPYQNGFFFNGHRPLYTPLTVDQPHVMAAANPLDVYSFPGTNAYQTNHIIPDQDLGTSETIKYPVAILRGAHTVTGPGLFGITMKRQDDTTKSDTKKDFTPSRRTSDWIPMSGSGVPLIVDDTESGKEVEGASDGLLDGRFSTSNRPNGIRHKVGDIISAKIPEEFSPAGKSHLKRDKDGDIVTGKISPERERRKGSIIDVYPGSSSSSSGIGDTSDLVVSSVIKFS